MPTTDHDPIDFTFVDDGDLVRKAPKAVPEDPVEKRLQRDYEALRYESVTCGGCGKRYQRIDFNGNPHVFLCNDRREANTPAAIEIRHGSGKVKV